MHPDFIDIGFLHMKTYGVCMAAGFLLCWRLAERISGRRNMSDLFVALMLAGVAGARAAYVIENWRVEFAARPLSILRIDQGGLVFYGGLVLALAVFFVWCRLKRERIPELADLLCTVIPLGHAFGRIGCFFYGCCYGRVCSSPLAVCFPLNSPAWYEQVRAGLIPPNAVCSLPVLPTQLFEAAALLALFALLLPVYVARSRKGGGAGFVAGIYLAGYSAIRFALEYLRGDPRAEVGPFSIAQTISFGIFVLGVLFMAHSRRNRQGAEASAAAPSGGRGA